MKKVIWGVSNIAFIDFDDPTKIIGLTKVKDVNFVSTNDMEPVTGGNSPLPFGMIPKGKSVSLEATNATFDENIFEYQEGTTPTSGKTEMYLIDEYTVPADKIIKIETKNVKDIQVVGYKLAAKDETTPKVGEFSYDATASTITFNEKSVGEDVTVQIIYESSANATKYSVFETAKKKPFKVVQSFPISDENGNVVGTANIVIHKAIFDSGTEFDFKEQSLFSPKFKVSAIDPKRADKQLWDFIIDYH